MYFILHILETAVGRQGLSVHKDDDDYYYYYYYIFSAILV